MHRLSLVCVLAALGCGPQAPFQYIPVSGRLTYEDGQPIPASGIRLGFAVQDVEPRNGAHPRPAEAVVNAAGDFSSATSYRPGDGLIPGKHKVAIYYATDAQGKLLVPKDYAHASTTPLVVSTDVLPIEIKVPRPTEKQAPGE
ncbi:MAG: hypothetical protein KF688_16220 [Pirellulales bacterium]|nr:hypothetical protein [Pirellulales bacterium]MBX3433152.1 hypothetical protein [Pirellulales bacterium]